jgi:MSHA biogenesis protein MshE
VAQRLVRRLCDYCKQPYQPDELEANWLRHHKASTAANYWHAPGCQSCNHSGYKGRLGVFELLLITKPLADALRRDDTVGFADLAHHSEDFTSLGTMALQYAQQGITSLDEVIRVSEYLDNEPIAMAQG